LLIILLDVSLTPAGDKKLENLGKRVHRQESDRIWRQRDSSNCCEAQTYAAGIISKSSCG